MEAVGLKSKHRAGTSDQLATLVRNNRHIMKILSSTHNSPPAPKLLTVRHLLRTGAALVVSFLLSQSAFAADFSVTSPGFFYAINGNQPNPTLTLVRGQTYTFSVNTESDHPFKILSPGVVNNNISQGTITYTVPTVASNYSYICSIHFFGAQILTVAPTPPPPPAIQILSLAVSNNVVLRSTGTNGWSVNPEFSTNLTTTNWFALTVLSNRFQNGISETICGRPPGSNVFFRIRSQPN